VRILQTANTYAPSLDGIAEVVRNISERMAKRGHEVHVATAAVDCENSCAELSGVQVHRFKIRGSLPLGIHGEIEKYQAFVRTGDWDVIVNHSLHVWSTDLLLDEIATYRWPSILVTQGLADDDRQYQKYYSTVPRYIASYFKWIRVSGCTAESSFAKRFKIPVPPIITNGVDMDEWERPPLDLRGAWSIGRKPWVVNVSNHSPVKDHGAFYELASCLRGLGVQFTLIAGTYPMNKWGLGRLGISGGCAYRCQLRSMLSPAVLDLRVNLSREKVVSAIREADIVVSTSKREANSIVLLESMAAGIPWVSFDVGSARENGGGVVAGNFDEMLAIVDELLQNPGRRKTLGTAGRAQAVARHDWDSIADQYEQLFDSAVATKRRVA
jgi:L-malate glycosyltransferase